MIAMPTGGPLIQDSYHAGVALRADGPAKALAQLDLHLRHHHGPEKLLQAGVILPLLLLHGIRAGERQPGDDQQGHAVAGKVKALPGGPGSQQDGTGAGLKLLHGVGGISSKGKQRVIGPQLLQPLRHGGHGGVGGEQRQGVAVGGVQQIRDLLCHLVVVDLAIVPGRGLRQVQQAVSPVVEG